MLDQSINPYEPPAATPDEVTHFFNVRSAGSTLRVGIHERHNVTVKLDLWTTKTLILLDGKVVRGFRYFFDPPPIRLEVGDVERHCVDIHLVSSMLRRPSHIDVDGTTVVPEIAPRYMWMIRVGTVVIPSMVAVMAAIEYRDLWGHGDWFTRLLTNLAIALAILLVTLVSMVEVAGLLKMKFGRQAAIKPP